MLLFRRRTTDTDFATNLIQLYVARFGRETLIAFAENDARLATALSEWLFFGAYVIRQGVSAKCGENRD